MELSSSLSKHHYSSIKEIFLSDELNKEIVKYENILDKITKYLIMLLDM